MFYELFSLAFSQAFCFAFIANSFSSRSTSYCYTWFWTDVYTLTGWNLELDLDLDRPRSSNLDLGILHLKIDLLLWDLNFVEILLKIIDIHQNSGLRRRVKGRCVLEGKVKS